MEPWPTRIRSIACRALALLALAWPWAAPAQSLESVLSPGKMSQAHAKWEDECKSCHAAFDRNAQDRLCMDCHKDVGQDLRGKLGFHGRLKPQACRTCHTEHKGREKRLAEFDHRQFDHAQTDFVLRGKHQPVRCESCHVAGKKFREAPQDCASCHRKDDPHKGSLGTQCADCHAESSWKDAKFDHSKTRFALTGKHADTKCESCHKDRNYKETPRTCLGCHKKDDDGAKGHKGLMGEKCDSCHSPKAWKPASFNHDSETKFSLRGKHRAARCDACHTAPVYKVKPAGDCLSCHKKDDKHQGSLGKDCASCHTETGWKEKAKFDHARTEFPLLGKHAEARCESCHTSKVFKEAPKQCVACHKKDDKHETTLGEDCASCHSEREWKSTTGRFDHDKTKFQLRNAHAAAKVQCNACHRDLRSFRKTATDCFSCHQKDDKHQGQLGRDCAQCHVDKGWKTVASFDHGLTRFPLLGRHFKVECKSCHTTPRFKDAQRECVACHLKDDKHKTTMGAACDQCHNARSWKAWDFDHDKRTKFMLDGRHTGLACDACHTRPAEGGKVVASSQCVACHAKNDAHEGSYGRQCQQCHQSSAWRTLRSGVGRKVGDATTVPRSEWAPRLPRGDRG